MASVARSQYRSTPAIFAMHAELPFRSGRYTSTMPSRSASAAGIVYPWSFQTSGFAARDLGTPFSALMTAKANGRRAGPTTVSGCATTSTPVIKWILENTFNGRFIANIEQKGKPSKWITLKALQVLKFYRG